MIKAARTLLFSISTVLALLLTTTSPVNATTIIKPDLEWQRSTEAQDKVVTETTVGSKVTEALALPLDPSQEVFDDGLFTPQVNKDAVGGGISWASWVQYSAGGLNRCGPTFELRHFQATFNLSAQDLTREIEALKIKSPYYQGDTFPINDNAYIYLNGNYLTRLGTRYGALNLGMNGRAPYANETDGWVANGNLGTAPIQFLQPGENTLDIAAGETCKWGGMGKLELVIETSEPPPSTELVMVVHGINADASLIPNSASDLEDPRNDSYRQLMEVLVGEFDEIPVFEYVEDRAIGGDSQTSIRDNSIKLAAVIEALVDDHPGKKVTLYGYSMGGTIIRGYLALFPEAEQYVDAAIILQGSHQGAWMMKVYEGVSPITISVPLLGWDITAGEVLNAIYSAVFLDHFPNPTRPAAVDLTPQSQWYTSVNQPATTALDESINTDPVPPQISYYNFYGDIGIEVGGALWRFLLPDKPRFSVGDVVLLPGTDLPTDKPLFGGARFIGSVDPEQRSEQWALESTFELHPAVLLQLLRGQVNTKQALEGLFGLPPAHLAIHDNMNNLMLDDRVSGSGTVSLNQEIVEIIRAHPD